MGINIRENEVAKFRCAETDKAIKDAIITGVGFLMITVDALDADGSMFVNYKKITKEDVLNINTNRGIDCEDTKIINSGNTAI